MPTQEVAAVLAQLENYLGTPSEEQFGETEASLIRQLRQLAEETLNYWDQTLTEIAVQLIEEPAYRLSGAEEAIRQMVATIEQVLQHQEPLLQELTTKARDAHAGLRAICAPVQPGQRRVPAPGREVVELLRFFAKTAIQSQLLTQVVSSFVTLRGHLSDQLREVNSCRTRLGELQRQIERGKSDRALPSTNLGRLLFPGGFSTLDEATQQFLAAVTPETLLELDTIMEEMIRKRFTALVNICLSPANILRDVELAMLETAEQFCNEKLPTATAAQLFLEQQPDQEQAADEIGGFYDEAKPDLMPPRSSRSDSVTILLAPPDEAGESFRHLAQTAMPEVEIHNATSTEDVLFYRECANLRLSDLPHLGGAGLMAYQQMNSTDHFTPHTRTDIDFKRKES